MIRQVGTLTSLVVMAACHGFRHEPPSDTSHDLDHRGISVATLHGRRIADNAIVGTEEGLALIGDKLVVYGSGQEPLRIIAPASGTLVRTVGHPGWGAGEFRAPWAVVPEAGKTDQFWVFDIGLHRLTHINLHHAVPGKDVVPDRTINLISDAAILWAVPLSDTMIVALGTFNSGRFAYFDSAGRMIHLAGSIPPGDDTVPVPVRQHAYEARLRPRGDGLHFALATRYAGAIEIYSNAGELLTKAKTPFAFVPRYNVRMRIGYPSMQGARDTRVGYVDLAVTATRLFGLFSGRLQAPAPNRSSHAQFVHVFDWSGNLLAVYELAGIEALGIAVDEKANVLYAYGNAPAPAVLAFPLPDHPPVGAIPLHGPR